MSDIIKFIDDLCVEHQEWRLKELVYIKTISIKLSENEKMFFLNSSISMIYSHWEGFVKKVIKELFVYIDKKEISNKDISDNLIVYSLEKQMKQLVDSQRFDAKVKNTKLFIDEINKSTKLSNTAIDTKSNLKDKVLIEILEKIGLDKSIYSKDDLKKLSTFVNIRNAISHGDKDSIIINIEQIEDYVLLITKLMDNLIMSIKDYLENNKYLVK